ncbi:YdiU family protein [Nocardioidaceae bacterium]|nr:YdiU family protein [Nocardioidaceae bacterium]
MPPLLLPLAPEQTYARDLDGLYAPWQGAALSAPQVLRLNRPLAAELGLDADAVAALDSAAGALLLTGAMAPEQGTPLAMAYAGHQFGGFSPLLGDGRAMLLGEVVDTAGRRRDVHLKGSGRTPFSRGGDGKAALGPVLREYLMGEAMHALGIPTTRALAAVTTGESVQRDEPEVGAVLARVAASHLRVGTLQLFASRGQTEDVRRVADFAIARHDPDLLDLPAETGERYVALLTRVRDRQAALVASWMAVGFVHGVLNTDNVTLSGETIDYGPCAFVDAYDPAAVFSSIDTGGRYAFGQQPGITQWNLARLAESMLPLLVPAAQREDQDAQVAAAVGVLDGFPAVYAREWTARMRAKLGLSPELDEDERDQALATELHELMQAQGLDLTRTNRSLSAVVRGDSELLRAECTDLAAVDTWLDAYATRSARETRPPEERAAAMDAVNPVYVPRNRLVDEAIIEARGGDMQAFDRLLDVLEDPFTERPGLEAYAQPAPDSFGPFVTYCGT